VLAIDPVAWLVTTWTDPAYDSSGFPVFAAVAAVFLWSAASPVLRAGGAERRLALWLLGASALVRLAGQVLAINMLGALCLVADVFALGLLARLHLRARAVSPAWLAVAFAFSLPLERVIQRSVGYLLQELSAGGACGVLSVFYDELVCRGVRLILNGTDVLVDLPCSGARTLLLGLLGYTAAAALCRPGARQAALGLLLTLAAAAVSNVVRISVLAVGLAEPSRLGGIDVMAQPWHDVIGIAALGIVLATITLWAKRIRPVPQGLGHPALPAIPARLRLPACLAVLVAALAIVNLPRSPMDVARAAAPAALPLSINGYMRQPVALSSREEAFFTRFGGWAAKAEYGPHGLLMTRTTSPLRHLHAPEDCLRGLGFEVAYLGAAFEPVPAAIYRATAPDGRRYRIEATFVADTGAMTGNVATAVWLRLRGEARAWTAVQRISPEGLPADRQTRFADAVLAALDLNLNAPATDREG
jgi:exosortase/archaeosortase family protein